MKPGDHILVTGGAGFIGSHLVERLLSEGLRVTIIDDFSTGSLANLQPAHNTGSLEVITAKVSEVPDLAGLAARSQFIFHLAAAVGVELVVNSPIRTIQTNLKESEVILEAASHARTPLLLASTSEVYGKSAKDSFAETDDLLIGPPTLGRWSYACSKLMDEFLGLAYHKERGVPVIITRLFNTVGPRQTGRYGMVLPRFVEAALAQQPLEVYGDGLQSRCFCLVDDTVEAMMRLAREPRAVGEVVNVGTDEQVTIIDLARKVIQQCGSTSQVKLRPYAEAYNAEFQDMARRRPSLQKLETLVGFRPRTALEEVISRTIASCRG